MTFLQASETFSREKAQETIDGIYIIAASKINIPSGSKISGKSVVAGKASFNITDKFSKQMGKRGWTQGVLTSTVKKPYTTRSAINKATGNKATTYFNKDGSYVVKDNNTRNIIQVSNRKDHKWVPDPTIENPYVKK